MLTTGQFKVLELSIISNQLSDNLDNNEIINPKQFGIRKNSLLATVP